MVQALGNEESQQLHGNEPLGLTAAFTSVNYPGKKSYNHKELHSDILIMLSAKFMNHPPCCQD